LGDGQNTPPNDSPEEPLPKEPLWDATAAVKLAFGESQSELDQDATPEFEKQAGKSKPPTPVALINQKDTFKEAATELHDSIANLHKENIGEKPILYRTTPGIGKTEGAIHLATNLSKGDAENSPLMPFMATTTRNMAWQAYERIKGGFYGYGHQVLMFEGRHDGYDRKRVTPDGYTESIEVKPNCENYEKVQRARQKGYPIQKFVCAKCPSYPHFKDEWGQKTGWGCSCKYFRTLGRVTNIIPHSSDHYPPIVLMSHAMAANVLSESELVQPSFVIADEDMTTSFRDEVVWSEEELGRLIVGKSFIALRALMRETIALVKKYKKQIDFPLGPTTEKDQSDLSKELRKLLTDAKFYDSLTIHGKALARFMEVAAQKAGFDIDQILEDAMLAEEPVDKGDLASMTDENFARLPHYKEIELAKELGSIRQLAQKDEERAYRVSLRYGSDSTWSYYWDEVRTITYGGPLVLLDAYADPKLAERLCNREVEVRDVHCKVRENVMVEHYPKVSTSRSSMDDPTYKKNLFEMWIAPALRRSKGKKVLIYTQKRYAEWIESEVEKWDFGLKACVIKWFWMDRGDDSYGDFDDIFVVGTPYSNISTRCSQATSPSTSARGLDSRPRTSVSRPCRRCGRTKSFCRPCSASGHRSRARSHSGSSFSPRCRSM